MKVQSSLADKLPQSDETSASSITLSSNNSDISASSSYFENNSRKGLPLPLYHPLGRLALSLPGLDPGLFGLPNTVTVDDQATPDHESDSIRRSSSRARKPAAKVRDRDRERERDRDGLDEETPPSGAAGTVHAGSRDTRDRSGASSPRKRRAAGGGGGAGAAKRKRKEPDDADGVYPPPAKRTRNPRGAGASTPNTASPLVSAIAATANAPEDSLDTIDADADVAATPEVVQDVEPAVAPEIKTAPSRPRRTRNGGATSRRRNSSASQETTTSASVSIATNANGRMPTASSVPDIRGSTQARDPEKLRDRGRQSVEKKEEEEAEEEAARSSEKAGTEAKIEPGAVDSLPDSDGPHLQKSNSQDQDPVQPAAMSARSKTPVPFAKSTQREEREEGELSDDGSPPK